MSLLIDSADMALALQALLISTAAHLPANLHHLFVHVRSKLLTVTRHCSDGGTQQLLPLVTLQRG